MFPWCYFLGEPAHAPASVHDCIQFLVIRAIAAVRQIVLRRKCHAGYGRVCPEIGLPRRHPG